MFKNKKKVEDYRKWIEELEKVVNGKEDNATKVQVVKNLIYVIKINDLFS